MLVVAVAAKSMAAGGFAWSGRRHDEDGPEHAHGTSPSAMFDAVYETIGIGEQVAIGIESPLMLAVADNSTGTTDTGGLPVAGSAGILGAGLGQLSWVLGEMGRWRPWTTATTSLTTWKATTSLLIWEAAADPEAAVPAFFVRRRSPDRPSTGVDDGPVLNLAAAAALRGGLVVDPAELAQPVLVISG